MDQSRWRGGCRCHSYRHPPEADGGPPTEHLAGLPLGQRSSAPPGVRRKRSCWRWGCLCRPACQRPSRDPPQPFPPGPLQLRIQCAVLSQGKWELGKVMP